MAGPCGDQDVGAFVRGAALLHLLEGVAVRQDLPVEHPQLEPEQDRKAHSADGGGQLCDSQEAHVSFTSYAAAKGKPSGLPKSYRRATKILLLSGVGFSAQAFLSARRAYQALGPCFVFLGHAAILDRAARITRFCRRSNSDSP